ncbi:MAG TPA: hypothetical protein VGU72_14675 [Beijerinckiaceae bacterium]|jgi:hypothetical protein|nr:hypothetical protein [Beijerinckiaceae bacterium]
MAVSVPPEQASARFGCKTMFARMDMPASSTLTQAKLGWRPKGSGLIADFEAMRYA